MSADIINLPPGRLLDEYHRGVSMPGRRNPDDPPCQILIFPDLRSPWVIGLAAADAARTPAQIKIDQLLRHHKAESWHAMKRHFEIMERTGYGLFMDGFRQIDIGDDSTIVMLDPRDIDLASQRFRLDVVGIGTEGSLP